jgi:hypothetical protein
MITSMKLMIVLAISSMGGIIAVETIGAATAWAGIGIGLCLLGLVMVKMTNDKRI